MRILHFLVQQYCPPPPFAAKSLAKFVGFFQILGELRFPYLCLVGFVGKQEIYTERRALHRRSHNREKRIQSRSNQKNTQKILTAMKGNPNITISELSKICEITVDGVKWQLKVSPNQGIYLGLAEIAEVIGKF